MKTKNKSLNAKKGQEVKIITGKYKGQVGKIMSVDKRSEKVVIENINVAKRHLKPDKKNPSGGIVNREQGIHISNIKVVSDA
jgi:large subunit ribosomal protein L24|tara:strand:+ start:8213 stop:8458 length:246 start_codon:yes stop_codon:yes gene_type:complete